MNCYCCTCVEGDDYSRYTAWDPACRNHGAHGLCEYKKHNLPAENCDCGCDFKVTK